MLRGDVRKRLAQLALAEGREAMLARAEMLRAEREADQRLDSLLA